MKVRDYPAAGRIDEAGGLDAIRGHDSGDKRFRACIYPH